MLETFLNVVPITIIVGIIYVIYRIIKIKKNKLSVNYFYEIVKFIFVCYLTGLINLVLVPSNLWSHFWFYVKNGYSTGDSLGWFSGSYNFVPSLYKYLIKSELSIGTWIRDMLIGNMLMFIPMGIMLPLVFKNINKKNIFDVAILITLSNPIRQNYGHCKALAELLNINESNIYNIVCIPSKAKLKIEHDGELVRYDTIVNKIMSYSEEKIKNVNELYDILIENNVKDRKTKKEHIKNIKTNVDKKDISKCPKCGGTLVERESKYGKFIGCSNYPQCKYTRKK